MHPILLELNTPDIFNSFLPPKIKIYSYGIFIALGVLLSFFFCLKRTKDFGVTRGQLENLFLNCILMAFIGGKLFYFLQNPNKYIEQPQLMLKNLGSGFVFYGSLIFTVPFIIYWLRRRKIAVRSFLDILAFVGPILHIFGRLGCFMAGCCYGKVCNNFLGVEFTDSLSKAKPLNTSLYPTQLFDIVVNLGIFILLYFIGKRKKFEGQLFLIYISAYAIGRSIIEIFRGDSERGFIFGSISHSQFIAIILLSIVIYFYRKWSKLPIINQ